MKPIISGLKRGRGMGSERSRRAIKKVVWNSLNSYDLSASLRRAVKTLESEPTLQSIVCGKQLNG